MKRPILAGVDGSESGLRAVGWAAREAGLRGQDLVLLSALALGTEPTVFARTGRGLREGASKALEEAERHARAVAPGTAVERIVAVDAPTLALLDNGGNAAMVVVGLRGRGELPGMKVGSVAYHVAAHSPIPVVVVGPEPASDANPEVVVGVGGSPDTEHTLAAAFESAAVNGALVRAVWAWAPPALQSPVLNPYAEAIRRGAEFGAAEALQPWRARHPEVEVVSEVVESRPVLALTRAASRACLVVSGARGLQGLPRLALGGVTHGLLHHAPCPVMIVH